MTNKLHIGWMKVVRGLPSKSDGISSDAFVFFILMSSVKAKNLTTVPNNAMISIGAYSIEAVKF